MAVNHEIPKCQKCENFMSLNNTVAPTKREKEMLNIAMIYVYCCKNINCSNQKDIEIVEYND